MSDLNSESTFRNRLSNEIEEEEFVHYLLKHTDHRFQIVQKLDLDVYHAQILGQFDLVIPLFESEAKHRTAQRTAANLAFLKNCRFPAERLVRPPMFLPDQDRGVLFAVYSQEMVAPTGRPSSVNSDTVCNLSYPRTVLPDQLRLVTSLFQSTSLAQYRWYPAGPLRG